MSDFWNKFKMVFSKKDHAKVHIHERDEMEDEMDYENKPDIIKYLKQYPVVKVFESTEDLRVGLLKYQNIPDYVAFLFRFEDQEVRSFHTSGMWFTIDISFFNKKGKLIKKYENVKPGVKHISSIEKCKYVVEVKS